MTVKHVLIAVLLTAAITILAAVPASSATVRHCPEPGRDQGPKNDRTLPIGEITTRNMTCRGARTAIRDSTFTTRGHCFGGPGGPPCETFLKTPGFHCVAPRLGAFRCTARHRRFSFGWSE